MKDFLEFDNKNILKPNKIDESLFLLEQKVKLSELKELSQIDLEKIVNKNVDDIKKEYPNNWLKIIGQWIQYEINKVRKENFWEKCKECSVTLNTTLNSIAQSHSEDMAKNKYFSHINKEWKDCWDRLSDYNKKITKKNQYNAWYLWENIAKGPKTIRASVFWRLNKGTKMHRLNVLANEKNDIWVWYSDWYRTLVVASKLY